MYMYMYMYTSVDTHVICLTLAWPISHNFYWFIYSTNLKTTNRTLKPVYTNLLLLLYSRPCSIAMLLDMGAGLSHNKVPCNHKGMSFEIQHLQSRGTHTTPTTSHYHLHVPHPIVEHPLSWNVSGVNHIMS